MAENDFKALEALLVEAGKLEIPAKEPTLFAVGGRGYYENPTSDLLAFFLRPDAKHGLDHLFLSTFLECMSVDHRHLGMCHVRVDPEVVTEDRKRIDLQILGVDWCLLIENKIYHWEANPFVSYEDHANRLAAKTKLYAVLSPSGRVQKEGKKEDWKGVSYKDYCSALRRKLPEINTHEPRSKWRLFAREFILHLENELFTQPMTSEQVAFVEKHTQQIAEVQKLSVQHGLFILGELKRRLNENIAECQFDAREETWAFRCTSPQWGLADMVLIKPDGRGKKFFVRAYLADMSEPRLTQAKQALGHMANAIEGKYPYWTSHLGYDSSEQAIAELCKLAQTMSNLLKR